MSATNSDKLLQTEKAVPISLRSERDTQRASIKYTTPRMIKAPVGQITGNMVLKYFQKSSLERAQNVCVSPTAPL